VAIAAFAAGLLVAGSLLLAVPGRPKPTPDARRALPSTTVATARPPAPAPSPRPAPAPAPPAPRIVPVVAAVSPHREPPPKPEPAPAPEPERAPAAAAPAPRHTAKRSAAAAPAHPSRAHQAPARVSRKPVRRVAAVKRSAPAPATSAADGREAYERGSSLLLSADVSGAVSAYREAVRVAPADPAGYRGLGLAYAQQGDLGAAIRFLRKYLKLAPNAPDSKLIARRIELLSHAQHASPAP
jgi:hypothetical protein